MDKFLDLLSGASGGFAGALLAAYMDRDGRTLAVLTCKVLSGTTVAYYVTPFAVSWLGIAAKHTQSAGFIVGLFGIVVIEWGMKWVKEGGILSVLPGGKKND